MTRIDVIVAGAGIWGCMVARRRAEVGRKDLEKRAAGGGMSESRLMLLHNS